MSVAWASAAAPLRAESDAELERLYATYAARVHGYCRRQLGGRAEAEDAAQTVFLHALRALRRGIVPETESAWLFTIAHNVCRTYWRGAARRRRAEDPRDPHVLEQVVADHDSDHDALFGLDDALARIPDGQRRAILLREWHGLSYREIAETLGTSQAAVEMLLFRARRSLAAELRGERAPVRAKVVGGLGELLSGLKLLLGGSSAAKLAAAAAVVVTLAAAGSDSQPGRRTLGARAVPAVASRPQAEPRAASTPRRDAPGARGSSSARRAVLLRSTKTRPSAPATADGGAPATDPSPPAAPVAADPPAARPNPGDPISPAPSPAAEPSPGPSAPRVPAPEPAPALPPVPAVPPLPAPPALPPTPQVPPIAAAPTLPALPDVPPLPPVPDLPVPKPALP